MKLDDFLTCLIEDNEGRRRNLPRAKMEAETHLLCKSSQKTRTEFHTDYTILAGSGCRLWHYSNCIDAYTIII